MTYETRPKATRLLVCDLCGEEIPETTYHGGSDHRGQVIREWWMAVVGSMPVQITPDEWEIVGPGESATETRRIDEREESQ